MRVLFFDGDGRAQAIMGVLRGRSGKSFDQIGLGLQKFEGLRRGSSTRRAAMYVCTSQLNLKIIKE